MRSCTLLIVGELWKDKDVYAIPGATTKNIMQISMAKKARGKLKQNSKNIVQMIPKWGGRQKGA